MLRTFPNGFNLSTLKSEQESPAPHPSSDKPLGNA